MLSIITKAIWTCIQITIKRVVLDKESTVTINIANMSVTINYFWDYQVIIPFLGLLATNA